jgi:hypothetical protein
MRLLLRLEDALEPLFLRLDRFGGGRIAGHRMREELRQDPRTHRYFVGIFTILGIELVIGLVAVVIAIVLAVSGQEVRWAVWFRSLAVLAITATLFYFALRAVRGWYWAYSRLRLFSRVFPIVTLAVAAIPGLYPLWMTVEQIVFSLLMVGIGDILTSDHMRDAFPKPARRAAPTEGAAPVR